MFPTTARYFRIILYLGLIFLLLLLYSGAEASDNLSEPTSHFKVRQGDFCREVKPLASSKSAASFYNYSNFEAHTGLEKSNESLLFLYENMRTKVVSLFVVHDKPKDGSGGKAEFSFSWLPTEANLMVKDDVRDYFFPDNYSFHPPMANAKWQWKPDHTDGLVISGVKVDGLDMKIKPQFISGIDKWVFLTRKMNDPVRVRLPSLTEPVTIGLNKPPQANFTFDPHRPEPGKSLAFDASSSFDPDGAVVKYEWDFGDGSHSFKKNPMHIYQKPGPHQVTLTVTDNCGAKDELRKTVTPIEVSSYRRIEAFPRLKGGKEHPKDDPPQQILPGIPFQVEVKTKINLDVGSIGLREKVPEGWEIEELPMEEKPPDPMKQKGSQIQWVWTGLKTGEDRVIKYQVTVPRGTESTEVPQEIKGDVEGFSPKFEIPVKGDSLIEVVKSLPIKVVIASLEPYQEQEKDPYCIKWTKDKMDCYLVSPEPSYKIDDWEIKQVYKFWRHGEQVPLTGGETIDFKTLLRLETYHRIQKSVIEPLG